MYSISNWARHHAIAARFLLALLHILLIVLAMLLCPLLAASHIKLSLGSILPVCIAGCGVITAAGYLRTKTQDKSQRFQIQKFRFAITGICCLILIISVFSSGFFLRHHAYNSLQGAFTETTTAKKERPVYENYTDKKTFYQDLKEYYSSFSKKELRKELRQQVKSLVKHRDSAGDTAIVAAIVVGMLLAIYLVIGLSCSIACNGSDALAVVVFIGGLFGVIWLGTRLIKKALGRKPEK